jgi:nucleotide-binding universal stress UspA family protein
VSASEAPFKRILVPVDFSARSANALEFAVALGSLGHAEIDVFHAWHSDLTTGVTVAKERAKNTLRDFVTALDLRGNVALRRRVDHGDAYLTIQHVAQRAAHDLIVVAGPEAPRANEDSVAKSLFASAPCAVLFVPAHCKARRRSEQDWTLNLERVLVPLALGGAELEALARAEALASADRAAIEVLTSTDVTSQSRARLEQHLQANASLHRLEEHEEPADVVTAVQKRARGSRFDLVVLCGERAAIGGRPQDNRAERVALGQPRPCLCLPA